MTFAHTEMTASLLKEGSLDVGTNKKIADDFEGYLKKNNIKYTRKDGVFEFAEAIEAKAAVVAASEAEQQQLDEAKAKRADWVKALNAAAETILEAKVRKYSDDSTSILKPKTAVCLLANKAEGWPKEFGEVVERQGPKGKAASESDMYTVQVDDEYLDDDDDGLREIERNGIRPVV